VRRGAGGGACGCVVVRVGRAELGRPAGHAMGPDFSAGVPHEISKGDWGTDWRDWARFISRIKRREAVKVVRAVPWRSLGARPLALH